MSNPPEGFQRNAQIDKPGIVGARWWHASLADRDAVIARRTAIRNILIAGTVLAGFGTVLAMCVKAANTPGGAVPDDATEQRKSALGMQMDYGWNFGAVGEALVFDGVSTKPFDTATLSLLSEQLRPIQTHLERWYVPTLFQSPYAVPTSLGKLPPEEAAGFQPLYQALKPIYTPAMETAYQRGRSFASLFAALSENGGHPKDPKAAVVVDLPGPEAVAFAAGASSVFDPVFLFDNWPHPRGVVRSQETLSAAAYYQPLFVKEHADTTKVRPPMFVLESGRLAPYGSDATEFDNRYVAKLPDAAFLKSTGITRVLYVVPSAAQAAREADDLNDDFVAFAQAGIEVKSLPLDVFSKAATSGTSTDLKPPALPGKAIPANAESDRLLGESGWTYYGGTPLAHHYFFTDYPWAPPPRRATMKPANNVGPLYKPVARKTTYSSGSTGGTSASARPRPTNFGTVPILVAVGTGAVLGARYSRSGSWNRSSGGSWG